MLLPLTLSKERALLVGIRGNFVTPPCCHSSTADPTSAPGLPAATHNAPLKRHRSPSPQHICGSLLVIPNTGMAVLSVGKEWWRGQHKKATLMLRPLGLFTSTIDLQSITNCESVMVSVTHCY